MNTPNRRFRFKDPDTGKTLVFLTNNVTLLTASIYSLPKVGWQAAVKSQILIAVAVYVLVAIVKKRLNLDALLYTLLQIFPVTFFWKMPLQQACLGSDHKGEQGNDCNQANRFAV